MKYKILFWNLGSAVIVELEDGQTAVVDVMTSDARFEDADQARTFGMWEEWEGELNAETAKDIENALSKLCE